MKPQIGWLDGHDHLRVLYEARGQQMSVWVVGWGGTKRSHVPADGLASIRVHRRVWEAVCLALHTHLSVCVLSGF